jgi:hypothetical protein
MGSSSLALLVLIAIFGAGCLLIQAAERHAETISLILAGAAFLLVLIVGVKVTERAEATAHSLPPSRNPHYRFR